VLAFAGIGRPEKFFAMLGAAGVVVAAGVPFADHHRYTPAQLARLHARAARLGAVAITTPKDAARLSAAERARVGVVGVRLIWDEAARIEALLAGLR
jgi:tetraacyldisaccharide 4'-kinase